MNETVDNNIVDENSTSEMSKKEDMIDDMSENSEICEHSMSENDDIEKDDIDDNACIGKEIDKKETEPECGDICVDDKNSESNDVVPDDCNACSDCNECNACNDRETSSELLDSQLDSIQNSQADDENEAPSAEKNKDSKKSNRFWKGLFIYCIVMVLLVLVASGVWWEYIREYEQTLPDRKAEEVAEEFEEYLSDELELIYIDSITKFEDWEEIFSELFLPAIGENFTYTKLVKEYTSEKPVYSILSGNDQVAKITLSSSGEKTLLGFEKWDVCDVELIVDTSDVNTVSCKIKAPIDFSVYINGVMLDESYKTSTELYDDISKWEKTSNDIPSRNVYTVSGLYGSPDVEIKDKNGNLVDFEKGENGIYLCDFPDDMRHSVKIMAPYNATVYLGGEALSANEISNSFIECEYTSKYDNAHLVEYTVSGLLTYPSVSAIDANGNLLEAISSEDENYVYEYNDSMKHSVSFALPASEEIGIKINGSEPEEGVMTLVAKDSIYPELADIKKYIIGISKLNVYTIEDLYGDPEITVTYKDGSELIASKENDGILYFLPSNDDSLKNEHEKLVEEYIDAYIRYTSGGYKVVDQTFDAAAKYLVPDSSAYEKLLSTKFSFGQNKEFFIKSREITSYDYVKLGSNCFSCTVDFTANIYTTYTSTVQNVTDTVKGMKLWYVYIEGEWKIAGLKF